MDSHFTNSVAISSADPVELLQAENRLLELATRNTPLPEILDVLAKTAERLVGGGSRCSILLLDKVGTRLLHGAAPNLPDEYNEKIHGIEIGAGVGSCGTAAATAQEVVAGDIETHPYWAGFKELAISFGLRACWSTPILSSEREVLGTFAIYYLQPVEPDARARDVVQMLSPTAALVIERSRLHERLTGMLEEQEQMTDLLRTAQQTGKLAAWRWNLADDSMLFATGGAEIFGVPLAEIKTRRQYMQLIAEEDRAHVEQAAMRGVETCSDFESEFRITADGRTKWLLCHCRSMGDNGTCSYVVGVTADITERKAAQDALRASEKLAATGRLAATIAHEINNPLEAVTNFIFLAKSNKELPPTVQRHLDIADQELARVTHIAQQTLGFYRDTTAPVKMDLATLLDDVVLIYERRIGYKSIKLRKEYKPGLMLKGFRGELRQVMSNLLANAVDASQEEQELRLRARIRTNPHSGEREVRVTVADSGSGIPQELQAQVFEPFFTTKKEVGTGLGLWVTRGIVLKHRGRISFRSRTGNRHGTVFMVTLPVDMYSQN